MTQQARLSIFANATLTRILRNLGWIMLSQGAVSVFGMITLAVTARALGAAGLGVLALVEAYTRIITRLVHFEPWQAVIHHGSAALEDADMPRFSRLIGLSMIIDLVGGLLAGLVALLLAPLLAPIFGLDDTQAGYLSFVALAALISFRPTGIALLRLYDRFDLLAKVDAGTAFARMLLSLAAYSLGGGLGHFVAIFIAFSIADGTIAFLFARREMKQRAHQARFDGLPGSGAQTKGFFRLFLNSNFSVMWRQSTERLDTLVLATVLPPVAIGYYHVARRAGEAALRLGRPLKQALYPELTRMAARENWRAIRRLTMITTAGFAFVMALVLPPVLWQIDPIVVFLFGDEFSAAAPVVAIQAVAIAITLGGFILGPTLLSLERDATLVRINAMTALLFFALLVPAILLWGVIGAVVTRLVSNMIWLICCGWTVKEALQALAPVPPVSAPKTPK